MPDPWPPAEHKDRLDAIAKARAWYSGDDLPTHSGTTFWTPRSKETKSAKWIDGTSIYDDEKKHVPAAADLALTASDFLFGGGVEYLVPTIDNDADRTDEMQRRVAEADELAGLTKLLPLGGEKASGMGEAFIRLAWTEENGRRRPLASLVDPDRVLPVFRWGRLVGARIWADLPAFEGRKWRHVETYVPGQITHELFRSTSATDSVFTMGEPEDDLNDHPATAGLESTVPLPDGMAGRMALLYVANADPRVIRIGGRSDTEGSEDEMAGLDMTMSSLLRDVDLGKGRILVDESMLNRTTLLGSAYFDQHARSFAPIGSGKMTGNEIKPVQFTIRATDHLATMGDLLQRIVSAAGYSPESLSVVQGNLPEAAAARRARERASLRTTERKAARWRTVIAEALSSLAVVAHNLSAPPPVTVELRSSMSPDFTELATAVAAARVAEIVSDKTAVRELHPRWTEAEVDAEVALIVEQRRAKAAASIPPVAPVIG